MQRTTIYNPVTDHRPINIFPFRINVTLGIIIFFILLFPSPTQSQSIDVKDEGSNTLIQIHDEGDNGGSILLPDASPLDITDIKLYNIGGDLYWDGILIGSCNCDITRTEFDDLIVDFDNLEARITALEGD